jgi:hypothetical protein
MKVGKMKRMIKTVFVKKILCQWCLVNPSDKEQIFVKCLFKDKAGNHNFSFSGIEKSIGLQSDPRYSRFGEEIFFFACQTRASLESNLK